MEKLRKKGMCIQPVRIEGRQIARSFWGQAWCDHLQKFSDYENRLPRGRTYIRNGSVCHLDITEGVISAMVSGSELYNVNIEVKKLAPKKWKDLKKRCAGQIGSLLELLKGRLSKSVMTVVTDRDNGLFPHPGEISLHCSCPDWAVMCKHVAAVLYGVGARLDEKPELLFLLRGVDHDELISADAGFAAVSNASEPGAHPRIAETDLSHLFGIEVTDGEAEAGPKPAPKRRASAAKARKPPSKGLTTKGKPPGKRKTQPKDRDKPLVTKAQDRAFAAHTTPKSRAAAKKTVPAVAKTRPLTGEAVSKRRKQMKMTKAQFARILDVSPATIGNWEKSKGPLNLHARTQEAWEKVSKLKKSKAGKRHGKLS
jgi:uncharacterized Zn finger protein/DNA-binding XRE family transcriptional regulator